MMFIVGFFSFCTSTIERDAFELANFHHKKSGLVKDLLNTTDSATIIDLINRISILEKQIMNHQAKCEKRYSDSLLKKEFEKIYKNKLNNKSNH